MKKLIYFICFLLSVQAVFIIVLFLSAFSSHDSTTLKATKDKDAKTTLVSNKRELVIQFLGSIAKIHLAQIELGKLAEQNGTRNVVKIMGKTMERIHSKQLSDLVLLANKKMIVLPLYPTNNAKDIYKKLNYKSGVYFDKAYCEMTVSKHQSMIMTFEKAYLEMYDADIKAWIATVLPQLRIHVNYAINCQKKCEKTV
jgi:putative membrane protein